MYRALGIFAVCAASAIAQTGAGPKDTPGPKQVAIQMGDVAEFGPIGITTAMAGPMATVAGAPYSAEITTGRVQLLVDGNRIEQTSSGSVSRDSQGRVRRDEALPALRSSNGEPPHLVFIEDPVAGVHWALDAQTKTAIKMPRPEVKSRTSLTGPPLLPPLGPDKVFFSAGPGPAGAGVRIVTKDLNSIGLERDQNRPGEADHRGCDGRRHPDYPDDSGRVRRQ